MLKPIKTDIDYDLALARIYELMQSDIIAGSANSDELEILSILVKEYESVHYPLSLPKPIDAIKFRLEQMNMAENELTNIFGHRSRKSEVLAGKRKLSLSMIRKLTEQLNIPASILIQPY